jgi:uncharacterized membrane protein YphA (DoxX/SURF4 family)
MMDAGPMPSAAQLLIAQLAAFLALLLAASSIHKWLRFRHTRSVVHQFAGVPRAAAPWAAAAAALGELLAGALLIVPAYRSNGALLAALILGAYLGLIVRAIAKGRGDVDCGCRFGEGNRRTLGAFEVVRNTALVIFALIVAGAGTSAAAPVRGSQLFAACALLALYGALDQVMGLQPMRRGAVL